MTEQNPAIFIQSEDHPAENVRRWIEALSQDDEGVFGGTSSTELAVSERSSTPNMSVDVATGRAIIKGDEDPYQGSYFVENRGVTNVAIPSADAANPRIDLIVAQVEDAGYSGITNAWSLAVVQGSAAASPSAPATPDSAIVLAQVSVDALASSIVNADITDLRPYVVNNDDLDTRLTFAEGNISGHSTSISSNASRLTTAESEITALELLTSSRNTPAMAISTWTAAGTETITGTAAQISGVLSITFTAIAGRAYLFGVNSGLLQSAQTSSPAEETDWARVSLDVDSSLMPGMSTDLRLCSGLVTRRQVTLTGVSAFTGLTPGSCTFRVKADSLGTSPPNVNLAVSEWRIWVIEVDL